MNPILDLASTSAALYLDLIERRLTNTVYGDGYTDWNAPGVERPYDPSLRETAVTGRSALTAGGCGRKFGPPDLRCRVRRIGGGGEQARQAA